MPSTTHVRNAALSKVAALMLEADENGHISVPVASLWVALDGVDVEGLAVPRPAARGGAGTRPTVEQARASLDGQRVTLR